MKLEKEKTRNLQLKQENKNNINQNMNLYSECLEKDKKIRLQKQLIQQLESQLSNFEQNDGYEKSNVENTF